MKNKIRLLFLGTPEFAGPSFKALQTSSTFEIIGVITQPDKAIGRHSELKPSPIKKLALAYNTPIYQPEKVKTEIAKIKELNPDIIVVVAYGQIIPQAILDIPTYGCVNVHGSLLPKYRGAACLSAPILNGNRHSGITIMKMDAGLDTGPILKKAKIKLANNETLSSLHDKLAELGSKILVPTLEKYIAGKIKARTQNNQRATYIKMLKKEDGKLDFNKPAKILERQIRALNPWPSTFAILHRPDLKINETLFKILAVRNKTIKAKGKRPGELFEDNSALAIAGGDKRALIISKLQLEGRQALEVDEFLRGNRTIIGSVLN